VTTVSRWVTGNERELEVVSTGSVPPLPPKPVHVTCQVVVTVTVKNRSFCEGPVCGCAALLRR